MSRIRISLTLAICSFWLACMGQEPKLEYVQLGGLEVAITEDFKANSHIIDGIQQTSIRKKDSNPTSMLIVSVMDYGMEMNDKLLSIEIAGIRDIYQNNGFSMGPLQKFTSKTLHGYKSEGTGEMMGIPVRVVSKFCGFSNFLVHFLEYYGTDYSSDYERIEESLQISTTPPKTGIQSISNNGFAFDYNADKMLAVTNSTETETTFTFTSTGANSGDCFIEFNFTTKDVDSFYGFASNWLSKMADFLSQSYAQVDLTPMEHATVLGQPGYMRTGVGKLNLFSRPVQITIKVCRLNGKFVWSITQQTLDENGKPSADVEEQFHLIEKSMNIIPN